MTRASAPYPELNRLSGMESIIGKPITQPQVAKPLKLSRRQVKRSCRAIGLQSKHRVQRPSNALSDTIRQQAWSLI